MRTIAGSEPEIRTKYRKDTKQKSSNKTHEDKQG
jgi:hypothetical protein